MRVGVIGGGQLAQMLALAGYPLGLKLVCLEPSRQCPAGQVTEVLVGEYADQQKLRQLAEDVDLITYEFENVSVETLKQIKTSSIYPSVDALSISQDRLSEKNFFLENNIPTTRFFNITSVDDIKTAVSEIGLPVILKTRRLGYDGKGQVIIRHLNEIEAAWSSLSSHALILENLVPFEREVSCIGVRSVSGECAFYPLVENEHRNGILHLSKVSTVDSKLQALAENYLKQLMNKLQYVGVLTVEFFQRNGELVANEMAPRVHNSGHWTIEGAQTSQFENHLRAILDLPLGSTALMGNVAMLNLVTKVPTLSKILSIPEAHCHIYGKEARPGRKLGHVTLCIDEKNLFEKSLKRLNDLLPETANAS
jgi:5-(carboxyamino)imidazole ribonucleotide synthase